MIVRELVTLLGFQTDRASLARAERSIRKVSQNMSRVGRRMTLAFTAPILGLGFGILKTAGSFESAMNRVQVLTDATAEGFQKLRNQAKALGVSTTFSATQAAGAMGFLAQAGFDVNEIFEAMPATLDLAAASKQDLATTADQLSNIMQGFGLETDQARRAADVLALTASSSNTNVTQLAEAMKFVAPMARLMGMSLEETSAILGLMGNAGLQATIAGTGLRMQLVKLLKVADSDRAKKALKNLGVSIREVGLTGESELKPLTKIFEDLQKAGAGAAEFEAIFGVRGTAGAAAVIGQGSEELQRFIEQLKNESFGVAAKQAKSQMKGLFGEMKKLTSVIEGLSLTIAESGLLKWATDLAKGLTKLTLRIKKTDPATIKMVLTFAGILAISGPLLSFFGLLGSVIATIATITLPMIGGFVAVMAVLGLVALAIQDVYTWMKGGDSVIGLWLGNWEDFRDNLVPIWESIKTNFKSLMDFMKIAWVDPEKAGLQFGAVLAGIIKQIEEFPREAMQALFETLTLNFRLGAKAGKFLLDEAVIPFGEGVGKFAFGAAQGAGLDAPDFKSSAIVNAFSRTARPFSPIDITINTEVNVPEGTTPDQADVIADSVSKGTVGVLRKEIQNVIRDNQGLD